jgi:phosphatidylglycerol---prolipoprotein diacylglyceryl transferase
VILGIDWTVDSQLIDGYSTPNLYGLLFVSGLIIGYFVIRKMFKNEHVQEMLLDKLLIYVVLATIIGARLGHVLFYGPYWDEYDASGRLIVEGYFSHPLLILKVWEGGLASHGAAIVILIVLYYFSKKVAKRPMFWILDRIVAPIAIAGCCIRLGNLVNHEIIGIPTDMPWGFKFMNEGGEYMINGEHVYRHPAQLYEAITYIISFFVLRYMYWKTNAKDMPGRIFGAFMVLIWTARFTIEFVKVGQTERDDVWALNTGQLLSIPFILIGVYLLLRKIPQKEIDRMRESGEAQKAEVK